MLYGVSIIHQRKEIRAHCDPCRKLILGGINLGAQGYFFPCRQDDCEHEDETVVLEGVEVGGEVFTVRKLKEI